MNGLDGVNGLDGAGGPGGAGAADGATALIGSGLAEAAEAVRVGPAPVGAAVAGGRRIRRRRRTLVGAVVLGSAVLVAGAGAVGLHDGPAAAGVAVPAAGGPAPLVEPGPVVPEPAVGPAVPPAVGSGVEASPRGERDPLSAARTVVGEGTADGRAWKAVAALWPAAADRLQALAQARTIWQEQRTAGSDLTEPTAAAIDQYWQPGQDIVDVYLTVDGVRMPDDHTFLTPAPGARAGTGLTGATGEGALIGYRGKGETEPPVDVLVVAVGPSVGRATVTWTDGTTSEVPLRGLGTGSESRWLVMSRPAGAKASAWHLYDRQGSPIAGDLGWFK
ncbi:hypothetical protein [Kitasatospora sp. A2-31]|uniref:hypothetical protein n=1 Tax=Kitasatospora sp. A2-31 TaxID=2916414 RepID=UPI001EEC3AA9|nr:hypothetical protein [Kitasatospora sp. A2-31]MCG6497915.1 hypothetical protein [Kitasatospora sp. A2-31]